MRLMQFSDEKAHRNAGANNVVANQEQNFKAFRHVS